MDTKYIEKSSEKDNEFIQQIDINQTNQSSTSNAGGVSSLPEQQPLTKRKKIKWTEKHVDILVDWADKAMCYRWLHSRNTDRYRMLNTWFTIPVIVMSTLTGTANFAQEQVPPDLRSYYSMIVGSVNILAGIITTIQNFLKISQLNESHRVASIAWDKFYRKIRLELAKAPDERADVEVFLKNCSEEFDRLIETSPDIDRTIIKKFKDTFEGKKSIIQKMKKLINHKFKTNEQGEIIATTERQKAFKNINKPAVYDYLESVRGSVYQPLTIPSIVQSDMETQTSSIPIHEITQINKKHDGSDKLVSTETLNVMSEIVKRKKAMEDKEKKIDHFCIEFKERYSRDPTEDEIVENLENEQEKITKAIISGFVSKAREKRLKKISINTNHVNEINGIKQINQINQIDQIDEINETKYTNDINENKIVKNDSVIIDIPSNI